MKYPSQHKPTPATEKVAARTGCMCQNLRAPLLVVVVTSAGSTR